MTDLKQSRIGRSGNQGQVLRQDHRSRSQPLSQVEGSQGLPFRGRILSLRIANKIAAVFRK